MTLISVVIPAYNCEATIRKTVDSVLAQSHSELEIIIVNDGSTDATLDCLIDIRDNRIKILSQSNVGLAATRNNGAKVSSGDYISFLDADDLWTSDKLASQFQALQDFPEAGVAYSWVDWVDNSEQFVRHGSHLLANGDVFEKLMLRNFIDNGSNILIRRSVLNEIGGFDESLSHSEDWDFSLKVAKVYPFVCVPKVQVLYRISLDSLSSNIEKMKSSAFMIVEKNFAQYPEIKAKIGRRVYGDRYRYLLFKSLENKPSLKSKFLAVSFFVKSLFFEISWWLERLNILGVVILKIIIPYRFTLKH